MNNNFYAPKIISVYELNSYLKGLLDKDPNLQYVFLSGEISNLTDHYSSGHIYLSLKDSKAVIKAVMFSFNARKLRFKPQNGMKVLVRGRVSVYEPSGQYQLYIEDMQPDGMGALTLAYEQLKEKLAAEGLFSKDHKKPLPQFPEKISVITSPTGAAIQDIRNVLCRRWPYADVELIPVLVQGEGSASQLKDAINKVSNEHTSDVVIIGRGGGSIEDLWSFNDEELARAIYNCSVPVISAVGHETDFTICDFVADMRAPTPSAAAELAVPDKEEQIEFLLQQRQYMFSIWDRFYSSHISDIKVISSKLETFNPAKEFNEKVLSLNNLGLRLKSVSENELSKKEREISDVKARLFSLDPVAILKRGYSVTTKDNVIIHSSAELKCDDVVDIRFNDGSVSARII
ncbi:MAG: exodeoxyribonuclease VII large subunit [Ruminococcaceae bacterium]|nr:exodeoxyribonuclease VII large subunit [Oscillospiraceae bacterium]